MKNKRAAFTLIELLVVIAIIAILAAILFPVFAQAKAAAKKTVDVTRFNQVAKGTLMYLGDTDGRYMMSNSGGGNCWGCGGPGNPDDKVPGMFIMPYCKNTEIFVCPNDPLSEAGRIIDHAKTMGKQVKDLTENERLYCLMVRSNMGYNYAFFSPWRAVNGKATSATITESEITNVSNTMMFSNSIWDRDGKTGIIKGGGNWVIETPCWLDANGDMLRPMSKYAKGTGDNTLQSYGGGWFPPKNPPGFNAWIVYGGTWPFHNQKDLSNISPGLKDGYVIIQMADTSTKAVPLKRLVDGCTAYGSGSKKGKVIDTEKFIWDLD